MVQCLIGLGSNLSDRERTLTSAWRLIGQLPKTEALRISRFFSTQPAGGPADQETFCNAAGLIETELSAEDLLQELLAIEAALGRVRKERWGPRAIDLDLLLYGDAILQTPTLTLPHPRMAFRRFVLEPAVEIAPDMVWPRNGWTIQRLLTHLDTAPAIVALASLSDELGEASLRLIAERCGDVVVHRGGVSADLLAAETSAEPERWHLLSHWPQEEPEKASTIAPSPKLVVILASAEVQDAAAEARRRRLRQRVGQPDVGPTLWLETDDAGMVADEVIAALAAMR